MEEKRCELRERRLKSGKIEYNNRQSVMDCNIRDVSPHGARLKIANTLGLPDEFQLSIPSVCEKRWARRAWTRYDEMGVQFL
jgi:hypothetical protein